MNNLAIGLAFYCLIPIISLEIFSQFLFRDELGGQTWIGRLSDSKKKTSYPLGNTHGPNLEYVSISPFASSSIETYERTPVVFRTDNYGSIQPSSIDHALRTSDQDFTLFCGGSVTEGWAVPEGRRIPDAYSSASGIHAVNLAKGGKTIDECLDSIERFFKLFYGGHFFCRCTH